MKRSGGKPITILLTMLLTMYLSIEIVYSQTPPPFVAYINHPWVDSTLKTLSLEQKIAQSIWLAAWSDKGPDHIIEIAESIKNYGIGGLVFFQGTEAKQTELIKSYQKLSKVPLTIAMDAEWGTGMRLTDVSRFPYQMTLGAIRNDSLIYKMGLLVAKQCRRAGVDINLAPVADINNNALNPVINYRSFGQDREKVAAKSLMYAMGLQAGGVMATAKHFPGHGDTDTDSHYDLPVISHNRQRFDSLEFYPFQVLINHGIGAVMTAHLSVPELDNTKGMPSSLSGKVVKEILKEQLGFSGLVISDAMNMKGVTSYFPYGEAEGLAYEAGNDILEYVADVNIAIEGIKGRLKKGNLTKKEIDNKCRRVLAFKYWSTQVAKKTIPLVKETSDNETDAFIQTLYENALTLLVNNDNSIPVRNLSGKSIAVVSINRDAPGKFEEVLSLYKSNSAFFLTKGGGGISDNVIEKLKSFDLVVVPVFGTDQRPAKNFGVTTEVYGSLEKMIAVGLPVIVVYFGNPYALDKLPDLQKAKGLLLAYQESETAESVAAQIIFGGVGARGALPVSLAGPYKSGDGLLTAGGIRLSYGLPEQENMSSAIMARKIDSITNNAINLGAFPGCEVMAARNGRVVFHKSYGYHTYDKRVANRPGDMYDLASVTKVVASLPAMMILEAEGRFSPDMTLGDYMPEMKHSDKADMVMREMLAHQAGLTAWIPFWKNSIKDDGSFEARTFRSYSTGRYTVPVADDLYLNSRYRKTIIKQIRESPLVEKKYLYSDIPFILSPMVIENIIGGSWTSFVNERVFAKMGADRITFNPYLNTKTEEIIPTEQDTVFRMQLIKGYVHDEASAMLGGVSGHAGLFSTGNDLMKILEMYRNEGSYGGEIIIPDYIVREYTSYQYPDSGNRRGLGFDKPQLPDTTTHITDRYPNRSATPSSFGHSGYTGTFVWVDPRYGISYLFLSNRVYPTRNNNLISELNVRTEILQALYDSVKN